MGDRRLVCYDLALRSRGRGSGRAGRGGCRRRKRGRHVLGLTLGDLDLGIHRQVLESLHARAGPADAQPIDALGTAQAAHWAAGIFVLARVHESIDGELAPLTGKSSRFGY